MLYCGVSAVSKWTRTSIAKTVDIIFIFAKILCNCSNIFFKKNIIINTIFNSEVYWIVEVEMGES